MSNKKIFFSSLIFLFIFISCSQIQFSNAQTNENQEYDYVIDPSWLYLDLQDTNIHDKLRFGQGGISLDKFENLGVYQENTETNEIVFASKLTFSFQDHIYTTSTADSIYYDINTQNTVNSYEYLAHSFKTNGFQYELQHYYTTYTNLYLGTLHNRQYYNEIIPITVGLNPNFETLANRKIGSIVISESKFIWEVKRVMVDNIETGKIGNQNIDITLPEDINVEITPITQKGTSSNSYALNQVAENRLGSAITDTFNTLIQTEIQDTTTIGHVWSNQQPGRFTFDDRIELRPRVSLRQHQVTTRYMKLSTNYDLFGTWNRVHHGLTIILSETEQFGSVYKHLTSAVIVENHYVWKKYTVEFNILATIELTAEEYAESLDDPFFRQGDWVWSVNPGGVTEMQLIEPNVKGIFEILFGWIGGIGNFFMTIFWIIIAIVGIMIFLKILPHLRRNKDSN